MEDPFGGREPAVFRGISLFHLDSSFLKVDIALFEVAIALFEIAIATPMEVYAFSRHAERSEASRYFG